MSYLGSTTKYVFKNAKLLFLLALLPSVVLAFFVTPMSSITFIVTYETSFVHSVADIIKLALNMNTIKKVYPLVLIFISLLISTCLILAVIERHFRTGRLNLRRPIADINETFFPVVKVMLVCCVLIVVYSIIYISVISLIHFAISGSARPNLIDVILSAVAVVIIFLVFVSLTGPAIFMLPLMLINGYAFTDAITFAFGLVGKKPLKITIGGVFPFLICSAIQYVLSFFSIGRTVSMICATLMYMFMICYTLSFIMIVMFDITGLVRKDKKPSYGIAINNKQKRVK